MGTPFARRAAPATCGATPAECLELTLPYSSPRELLMDIQRFGADAEVIAPKELREEMRTMLAAALGRYGAE